MKVWFITGASSGLGKALAEAVLTRGDSAILTARRMKPLQDLAAPHGERALCLQLDVTDTAARRQSVDTAINRFGHIDVLANIAGAGAFGALEEFSSEQLRALLELNFFSAAELCRELLPHMRERRCGHILNMSSIAGLTAFPGGGLYSASKFALEGFTEALHHEVKPLGIRATLIEPGAFRTDFIGDTAIRAAAPITDYAELNANLAEIYDALGGRQAGDPVKAAQVIIDMVDSDTAPLRLMLGNDAYQLWEDTVAARNRDLAPWRVRGEDTAFTDSVESSFEVL